MIRLFPRPRVVKGLLLRTFYVDRHNPGQLVDVVLIPVLDLLVWGLLTLYIKRSGVQLPKVLELVLGARVLWAFLYRSQTTVALTFLEDIWSRNFVNVFVSPVRLSEVFAATGALSMFKASLGAIVLTIATRVLYQADVLALGITGLLAIASLFLMGWALGVATAAIILRWGTSVQALTWALPIALQPISAVYYPVSMLPSWLQGFAMIFPSTHAFEGMRAFLDTGTVPWGLLLSGLGWALVYAIAAGLFFRVQFDAVRRLGLLAKAGH
ncbi:ABC transporter permease [Myxococcota bacterium]|nr:ABC transporter permease [Myxococcota bacterium]